MLEISFGKNVNKSKKRNMLIKLYREQNKRCFYCNKRTMMPPSEKLWDGDLPKCLATIEHVYHKRDIRRTIENKIVMACYKCNQNKNDEYCMFYKSFETSQTVIDIRRLLRYSKKR